ncbi:MAG TPA: bifunctional diguanylate cyclase/phosphodiesterase [Stackebrandtia sp.]|uniref:putative bifunctional diguanylate cyclase/phosphodiesterase n=1 Tax=Stackebrandtia sp. TaxID=2023065 RepID=UPI002D55FAF3|nr:bifunctional diguanylate cyclase/phosphodiesterase [Stackebrandtia sp.]HZE41984.1 bifunctional diguanylate cyclase/phosphodiesterase [Stackebrandtia sp.]
MTTTSLRNTAPARRRGMFQVYVAVVIATGVAAVSLTLVLTPSMWHGVNELPMSVWFLAALALAVEARPLLPPGARFSQTAMISLSCIMALLLMWGFLPALIVQTVVAILIFGWLRATAWRIAFNAAQFALALTAAHLVLVAFDVSSSTLSEPGNGLLPLLLAGGAWFLTSHLLVCTVLALRMAVPWWQTFVRSFGYEALVHGALLALAPILAVAASANAWLGLLAAVPIYAVYRMAGLSTERERIALTDPLTALPNRKGFQQLVEENLVRCGESDSRLAVMVCDIDRFAAVNNSLGHDVGDRLLLELAGRFSHCLDRPLEVTARTGGDEFSFLLAEIPDVEYAHRRARCVQSALDRPVELDEVSLDVSGAIGIACYPEHGADFDALFRHANVAMAEAKKRGSGVAVYAAEFDHHSPERLALLGDLRRALETPGMPGVELYYQPQVHLSTGEVVGVEALLRYTDPVQGEVDAGELIALAEHSAVMRILTYRVLDEAVAQLARWRADGVDLRVAVNVSVRDLHAPDFCEYIAHCLARHDVPAHSLQLEITESALMADPRRVVTTLKNLEAQGISLSLDDFGTGFSSMKHLRSLQVSEVKIDKSFVLGMREEPDAASIVKSIIELGRALGLRVVAEGVEDEATWKRLVTLGCDTGQGWFHARPMPAAALEGWLARYRPPALLRQVRSASTTTVA